MKKVVYIPLLLAIILLLHSTFYSTNFIQEDAYITWQCATTLAKTGVYGFNANEKVSASTTHLYVFISAFFKIIAGKNFILVIFGVNVIALVSGLYLLAGSIFTDYNKKILLWFFLSISPYALLISISGMETSLLILLIGLLAFGLRYDKNILTYISLFLLPWVRPDAVAIGFIFLAVYSFKSKKILFVPVLILLAGAATLLAFNYLYFGSVLNQTILAKRVAYKSDYGIGRILGSAYELFTGGGGIYAPFISRVFDKLKIGIPFLIAVTAIGFYYIRQSRTDKNKAIALTALFIVAMIIPLIYILGGIIFPWYTWPSSITAFCVVGAFLIDAFIFKSEKLISNRLATVTLLLLISCAGQWIVCLDWGTYEKYRTNIGLFLKENADPLATILLEPAGYIPYYSRLYTYDEIGLVSPIVTEYRKRYSDGWFIKFIQDKTPTYLIEREHLRKYISMDGYSFSNEEKEWFIQHYELQNVFTYNVSDYHSNPLILRLLKRPLWSNTFYVYKLKNSY